VKTKKISPFKKKGANRRRARKKWPPGSRSQPSTPVVIDEEWENKKEDDL